MHFHMQLQLNYLSNYVPTAWSFENGCGICDDDLLFLEEGPVRLSPPHVPLPAYCGLSVCVCVCFKDEEMPLIYIGIFIEHATPFMEEFLERLTTLSYPLSRLRIFIHNNVGLTETPSLARSITLPCCAIRLNGKYCTNG